MAPDPPPPGTPPIRAGRGAARILVPVVLLYFALDAVFAAALAPLRRWLARLAILDRLAARLRRLGPYPALVLVLAPLLVLEPAKPVGFYLIAVGHPVDGVLLIACAEVLKVVVVERLFRMTRETLLRIPAFAAVYRVTIGWIHRIQALRSWRMARLAALRARRVVRKLRGACRQAARQTLARWRSMAGRP